MKGSIWGGRTTGIFALVIVGVAPFLINHFVEPAKREFVWVTLIGIGLFAFVVGLFIDRRRTGFAIPGRDNMGLSRPALWLIAVGIGLSVLGAVQWLLHLFGDWFNNALLLGLASVSLSFWWVNLRKRTG